jgi:hypothetical protein
VYVPAASEKVGVTAGKLIVYAAEATSLSEHPLAIATAFSVSVALTLSGALYTVELVVGVEPSVV